MPALNDFQLDALREVGNVGAGNAATALSQLTGRRIDLSVSKVCVLPTDAIAQFLGGSDADVASVCLPVYGDVTGVVLVFFPLDQIPSLTRMLLPHAAEPVDPAHLTDIERSALREMGSILTGAYLGALFRFIRIQILHGLPELVLDMAQAILDSVLVELEEKEDLAIVIESELTAQDQKMTSRFLLLPEAGSLERLFKAFANALGLPGNG
ncbi:MAG TPA: chemotaxis protein CheC [bacterium]|nr:chemotaxis protein CheC [bacterium]